MKQFVIDGVNLLERFLESVGKVVEKIRCSYLSTEIAKQTIKCENSQIIQEYIDLQTKICYHIWQTYVLASEENMKISYKKLWKLLIDRDMMKKDLAEKAGISNASIAKLGRNENVNTDILLKICVALKCDIEDILEIVPDESE